MNDPGNARQAERTARRGLVGAAVRRTKNARRGRAMRPVAACARAVAAALTIAAAALAPAGTCRADVVPPEAVDVAERWLVLVDAGRYRDAIACCADPGQPDAARALAAALRQRKIAPHPARVTGRIVTSWAGRGEGDSSRMAPGGYFAMTFETTTADGRTAIDEVRLVPLGDGRWRVVGFVSPPAGPGR